MRTNSKVRTWCRDNFWWSNSCSNASCDDNTLVQRSSLPGDLLCWMFPATIVASRQCGVSPLSRDLLLLLDVSYDNGCVVIHQRVTVFRDLLLPEIFSVGCLLRQQSRHHLSACHCLQRSSPPVDLICQMSPATTVASLR